jgi:hypothetical protein
MSDVESIHGILLWSQDAAKLCIIHLFLSFTDARGIGMSL